MTLHHDNKIILQPLGLMTISEVTMNETDDEWLDKAKSWISADCIFGEREVFLLTEFRRVLKSAPRQHRITKRNAQFLVRYNQ